MEQMQDKKIGEILTSDVIGVHPETSCTEAIRLMSRHKISCIPVLENQFPIGLLTERSIVTYAMLHKRDLDVCQSLELMSSPVLTVNQEMGINAAYDLLLNKKIRHLVVVDNEKRAVGVVTFSNIIEHLGYDYFVEMKKTSQIMTKIPFTLGKGATAQEAMTEMAERSISCLIITAGRQPVGILTERDMIRLLSKSSKLQGIKVEEVMSSPVHTIFGDAPVLGASRMMRQKKIRRLVVVDDKSELLGLVTQYDIVKGVEVRYIENLKHDAKKKNLEIVDALKELGEKNVYLDNLLSSSIDMGIAATDLNGDIIHFNPAAEKIFGLKSEAVIGRDIRTFHLDYGLDLVRFDQIMEKIQAQKVHTFSFTRKDQNGLRYCTARVSGIRNPVHRLVGLLLICQDVTESRRAEEEINRKNKSLAKRIRELNCLHDISKLTEKNGRSIHETLQKIVELIPSAWQYPEIAWARIVVSEREYTTDNFQESNWRQGGDILVHGQIAGTLEVGYLQKRPRADEGPFLHEERALLHTIAERLAKIIEQQQADEALQQSLAIQQAIIDGGTESIMVIDRDYRVRMTNKIVQQLHLQFPEQNTHSMFCYEITHRRKKPCAGKEHRCPMREVIRTKKPCTLTHTHTRNDGYKYPVEIIASPVFNVLGEVVGIVEVGRDITKRLLLEEERKKNDERIFHQQKAESIATLAGGVAHDFNNILTIVLGNAELLRKSMGSDKLQCQFVDAIIFATQRMSLLIRQLLAYANSGKSQTKYFSGMEAKLTPVSLNQLLQETLELLTKEERIKMGVQIDLDLEQNLSPVHADAAQTRKMLENILLNAVESMDRVGGRLKISTVNVLKKRKWTCSHHDEHPAGEYVRLSIADNGCGIPKNIRDRIFEPFFSTKFVGRGLGLAAALGIARNQEGCISVEHCQPHGSIFHLLMPCAKND